MNVREPYLQCAAPNSTQTPIFDYYQSSLITNNGRPIAMVTDKTLSRALKPFQTTSKLHVSDAIDPQGVSGLPDAHGVVMSAFDPLLGEGMADLKPVSGNLVEPLNTWQVDLPASFGRNMGYTTRFRQPLPSNATEPGDFPECHDVSFSALGRHIKRKFHLYSWEWNTHNKV